MTGVKMIRALGSFLSDATFALYSTKRAVRLRAIRCYGVIYFL